ncbi:MAG: HPr(Ser) kinase/phosphatase [Verrucomicrobia bacterium]|nr:MAG: HPr(Ser) kinase/phosphatase [Verrucomicrobiota bacterium]
MQAKLTVRDFYEQGKESLSLSIEYGEKHLRRPVYEAAINRPGLALAGFFQYFANRRIQVVGLAEYAYLKSLPDQERTERMMALLGQHVPCLVITRNRHALPEMVAAAGRYRVPILRSPLITSRFINIATVILENMTAPSIRVQGTMVDIMGIGVLIEGRPGIGKSEVALGLIERGYSLVADDVTVLRRESSGRIIASAPEITRYHMEIRGLGIIHVPSLFGVASMRKEMRLDIIVHLHPLQEKAEEDDRTGFNPGVRDILGVRIPVINLPVAPGRDMAHVVEVAALNQKLRNMGHDAAKELDEKLVEILVRKSGQKR